MKTYIPEGYKPSLGLYDTQKAIGVIKNVFQVKLSAALHLKRVTAPLFVEPKTGLNDAVITGIATVHGEKIVVGVMDSNYMMGSMGRELIKDDMQESTGGWQNEYDTSDHGGGTGLPLWR